MFMMGGPVNGGRVYGPWPGLSPDHLNEGRDLALTTDFCDIFAEVLVRHMASRHLDSIFPAFSAGARALPRIPGHHTYNTRGKVGRVNRLIL